MSDGSVLCGDGGADAGTSSLSIWCVLPCTEQQNRADTSPGADLTGLTGDGFDSCGGSEGGRH